MHKSSYYSRVVTPRWGDILVNFLVGRLGLPAHLAHPASIRLSLGRLGHLDQLAVHPQLRVRLDRPACPALTRQPLALLARPELTRQSLALLAHPVHLAGRLR